MDNSELLRAISVRDINQVKQVLKSGQFSLKGDGLMSAEFHPIVQCIKFGYWAGDERGCEILELLVRHGANTNICYLGKTVAIFAAELNHWDCLQFLCDFGADLSFTTEDGDTALTIAAKKGNAESVKCLADRLPKAALNHKNNKGQTALIIATKKKHIHCMKHLIAAGADMNVGDSHEYTPLILASQIESTESVELLLDSGAQINKVGEGGETFLGALVRVYNTPDFNSSQLALKALHLGLDPTLSRKDHYTVHIKLAYEEDALLRALVMNGFPPLDLECSHLFGELMGSRTNYLPSDVLGIPPTPISPLALALLLGRPGPAWYFIANNFFTQFDIAKLCWNKKIREFVESELKDVSQDADEYPDYCSSLKQCLEILKYLSPNPHSLHTLSLVAISTALSQNLVYEPKMSFRDKESWTCRPTFRERVDRLKIPPSLKRELLHQTPLSGICCVFWNQIPQCEEVRFETCHCNDCEYKDGEDDDDY